MPAPKKLFTNGDVVFVTSRIEEGLPLVPTLFLNAIILSILAKAQLLYGNVELSFFIFLHRDRGWHQI